MNTPSFIVKPELYSIYEKIELYISSNFPKCNISINNKSVGFGYANEYTRIFIYQDKEQSCLVLKITQDITKAMGANNGLLYKIKTMDDVQHIISGIKVILSCRMPTMILERSDTDNPPPVAEQTTEQGNSAASFIRSLFKKSNNS